MPVKNITTGTGITKRHTFEVSAPFDREEELAAMHTIFSGRDYTLEGLHGARIEGHCRRILEKENLAQPGASLHELINLRVGSEQPDSPTGYAVRFLKKLWLIRTSIETARAADAAWFGFELGVLVNEAETKFKWEAFALRGERHHQQTTKGRAEYNLPRTQESTKKKESWRKAAQKTWKRSPDLKITQVALQVARSAGLSPHQNEKDRKTLNYIRQVIASEKPRLKKE